MPIKATTLDNRLKASGRISSDADRPRAAMRGYGRHWQQARLVFLRQHPLCESCLHQDRTTAATVVDHIIPHRGNTQLFWDRSNWQALCTTCHNVKTIDERTGRGQHQTYEENSHAK